ncbi:hypothetical protein [Crocosphaera chwakensis]|uniref:Uncharacterized protein n=1 Tax=Crocosphaera chwakensis CCY0110 TaxID=391612 RepID=A3IL84_9CHRO|nr:hypothetical protein [Crocosphaera chwakensis]EAZ92953.1 hypothetical protein CY0110_22692 [Crocosphaera chwakensis CCY0110]
MANSGSHLQEDSNDLVKLNYNDFLGKIIEVLDSDKSQQLFDLSPDKKRLLMNIDELAYQVSLLSINDPFCDQPYQTKCASINFFEGIETIFSDQLHLIQEKVKELLENELPEENGKSISIQNFLESIATPLETLKGEVSNNSISFNYPFEKQYTNLRKQQLTLIVENTFEDQDKEDNDIYKLKTLMKEEALGKIKKAANIKYLEFLYEKVKDDEDAVYFEDLIRRLKLIEAYINDETKPDDYYTVSCQGIEFNFQQFFNNSYAFDSLPIISQIEGYLGEMNDRDKDKQEFVFGMKLKLNGQVHISEGESSFDYHTSFLNLDKKENKAKLENEIEKDKFIRKLLKVVFLYYFVFASRSNPSDDNYDPKSELSYDPVENFEEQMLPILKGNDDQAKKELFLDVDEIFKRFHVSEKLNKLRNLLIKSIENPKLFDTKPYTFKVSISQGILHKDLDIIENSNTLFKPELSKKDGLKYISVNDNTKIDTESLCSLSVDIKFNDIQYFRSNEEQQFSMKYDLEGIKTIPMILTPQEDQCRAIYKQQLKNQASLVCNYNHQRLKDEIFNTEDNSKIFWYQLTFSLLTYLSLKVLLDESKKANKRLFIPLLRLQLTDKDDSSPEEVLMRSFSYVLSHLLNEYHRFSCQGICVRRMKSYTKRNSLSSLYSILPKTFKFDNYKPQLDKLAIIAVSSWECDRKWTNTYQKKNMIGEVICLYLYRQQDTEDYTIRLDNQGTFSSNYDTEEIYKYPDILINKVTKLYNQGYRHFLYIAKSPYSNYLNITGEDRELYFMSPDVINALKINKNDINIYPIFFDKYYVVKLQELNAASLYIQDTTELT